MGISPGAVKAARAVETRRILDNFRKREEEHKAWLQTPEGLAATARQAELLKNIEEKARLREEEDKRFAAFDQAMQELRGTPPVGEIFEPTGVVQVSIQPAPKLCGGYSAFALLKVVAEYPDVWPHRELMSRGAAGLKVFLDNTSRKYLAETYPEAFLSLEKELERLADYQREGLEVDYVQPDRTIYIDNCIQIIGISESGKSVHGKLIL